MRTHESSTCDAFDDTTALLAHDMRSPLSAMAMNLDFALAELTSEASCSEVREALADCRAAGATLQRMVSNLVDIARARRGELRKRCAEIDTCELLANVVARSRDDADARRVTLELAAASVVVLVDAELCERALVGAVSAILRAARAGDRMRLEARVDGEHVVLSVTGDVSIAALLSSALDWQFACTVAEAHGGRVDASGARISLILPRALS